MTSNETTSTNVNMSSSIENKSKIYKFDKVPDKSNNKTTIINPQQITVSVCAFNMIIVFLNLIIYFFLDAACIV